MKYKNIFPENSLVYMLLILVEILITFGVMNMFWGTSVLHGLRVKSMLWFNLHGWILLLKWNFEFFKKFQNHHHSLFYIWFVWCYQNISSSIKKFKKQTCSRKNVGNICNISLKINFWIWVMDEVDEFEIVLFLLAMYLTCYLKVNQFLKAWLWSSFF